MVPSGKHGSRFYDYGYHDRRGALSAGRYCSAASDDTNDVPDTSSILKACGAVPGLSLSRCPFRAPVAVSHYVARSPTAAAQSRSCGVVVLIVVSVESLRVVLCCTYPRSIVRTIEGFSSMSSSRRRSHRRFCLVSAQVECFDQSLPVCCHVLSSYFLLLFV